ncbi:MAG: acyl-CoA thioesterase [Chloroflexi bacterium]|nr:acyl-CoA thioesterase [Chloroflexota bacterium]
MNSSKFPYEIKIEVAFRDIDAMGHVNNAVFFSYFELARIKYVMEVFEPGDPEDFDLLDMPLILVEATCSYKSPALLGETLQVGVGLSRFGTKSFDLFYRILGEDGRLVAAGKTIQVMYDYGTRSAYAIPEKIREQVNAFQGGWQSPQFP